MFVNQHLHQSASTISPCVLSTVVSLELLSCITSWCDKHLTPRSMEWSQLSGAGVTVQFGGSLSEEEQVNVYIGRLVYTPNCSTCAPVSMNSIAMYHYVLCSFTLSWEPQSSTDQTSLCVPPSLTTHCSPTSIHTHLHPTFAVCGCIH